MTISMPSSPPSSSSSSIKTLHDPQGSTWLNQASMVWDPSMIDSNSCYWDDQWLSILRATPTPTRAPLENDDDSTTDKNHDHGSQSRDNNNKRSNSNQTWHENHYISYQTLFATAALMVVELRNELTGRFEQQAGDDNRRKRGMPVIVAIPEGPLLPLATLVVHALNQPVAGTEASCFAILVPLEPSEAKKRNLHILKDITPSMILAVPGRDFDNLRLMVDSLATITPEFVDFSTLLRSVTQNMDEAQNVIFHSEICLDANSHIGTVIADLANELSHELQGAQTSEKGGLLVDEPRVSHIVYTSGTTGIPKGCISSISSLEQYLKSKNKVHDINQSSTVLLASALSFDPCLSDCLATFQARATLALAPRSTLLSDLPNILQQLQVTHVLCTPTLWSLMDGRNHRPAITDFPKLQVVALGGEPIPAQLQNAWGRQGSDSAEPCRLLATYGVTEACVYQTCGEVFASSKKTKGQFVGQPLEGIGVRICQEGDQDKLIDVEANRRIGEIVLYGSQLDTISGYLNRPDLNRKFQIDGTTQHYRTGDRGTFDAVTNSLHVSGRIVGEEGMVKVNGVRVELGEIENALIDVAVNSSEEKPVVLHCMAKVVSVVSSTGTDAPSPDRKEIRVYCVLSEDTRKELNIKNDESSSGLIVNGGPILTLLRSRCLENLKAACIPKAFVIIPRLPLSATGKRNRDGLLKLDACRPLQSAEEEPVLLKDFGKSGKKVAEVLTELLNLQPSQESMLTTRGTFAMLGGDSLTATLVLRALYAYHHNVQNNRNLGGEYGKLTGAFDVLSLLGSENLGAYVELLDSKKLCQPKGEEEESSQSLEEEREPDDDQADVRKPQDAEAVKQKVLYDALVQAISLGQSSIAMGLLNVGACPNHNLHSGRLGKVTDRLQQRAMFRSSPIHIACLKGDASVVKKLLEKGSKTNSPDASGRFPIHFASMGIQTTDETTSESEADDKKQRLLCVQYLLDAGAPMTMRDGNKQSILHCASRSGHCELLKFVMSTWKDKNPGKVTPKHFFNWNDRWLRTAVHWAVLNGKVEALQVLLEMGSSPSPFKPKRNNRSSAAVESPMDMCQRLYDIEDGGVGTKIHSLLSRSNEPTMK